MALCKQCKKEQTIGKAIYCPECKRKRHNEVLSKRRKSLKDENPLPHKGRPRGSYKQTKVIDPPKPKPKKSIIEVAKEAKALHMEYGDYVAKYGGSND